MAYVSYPTVMIRRKVITFILNNLMTGLGMVYHYSDITLLVQESIFRRLPIATIAYSFEQGRTNI